MLLGAASTLGYRFRDQNMRTFASISALLALTLAIAGCGGGDSGCGKLNGGSTSGGSSSASCNTGTGTGSTLTTLAVTSSVASIASDGSTSATITVVAKDANNALVSGATVSFTASAGNITAIQATTDATGTATASLVAGSAAAGSTITVTASSGTVSGQTSVTVANTQKTLTLLTSLPQIPSDGSKTAKISALVRDANNNFVTGTTVSFVATSGGLTITQPITDATGTATAMLSSAGDTSNRIITVTARAGTTIATITVAVIGTKLTVSGPASLVQGSMGTYTVSLTDAGGNGIPNQTVTLTSSAGNTLTPATYMTDATGQKTFTMTAVNGGNDTITVAAAGLQATQTVAVSNQSFTFTAPVANTKVNLGVNAPVTVNWSTGGVLQVGMTVTFSATRGTLSAPSAVTDAAGNASVTISSNASGPSVISASATGVTAQSSVDFVATTPASLKAQASPATIATQGTSTITVTVRDAQNNLVEGQTVNFSITQDSTGGSLSVSSGVTDAQGQASTVYTASTTTSANNGVIISATVQGTAVTGTTSLTVAGQTVFLSLGTGNTVIQYVPPGSPPGTVAVQYELPYSVQAVDNAGHGVNNVPVTFTVTSLAYLKGVMVWNGSNWQAAPSTSQPTVTSIGPPPVIAPSTDPDAYLLTGIAGCASEDVNNNGILTTGPGGNDYNANGKLDPGLVAATDVPNATTANGGSASVNLIYPKDHAYWVGIRLTATATVAGTQSSTSADFWLPGAAIDYGTKTTAPPGPNSPYGQALTCKDPN